MEESFICANESCKSSFNQSERFQIYAGCEHSYCLICFLSKANPEEFNFICELDKHEFKFKKGFIEILQKRINSGPLWIFCDIHPVEYISSYCQSCQAFVCSKCCVPNHKHHFQNISEVSESQIVGFFKNAKEELNNLKKKAENQIAFIDDVMDKKKSLKGKELKE